MSVQVEEQQGDVVSVRVTGRVTSDEWEAAQKTIAGYLKSKSTKTSLLVDGRAFEGWEPGSWEDLWFQREHDEQLHRIAIVVTDQWADRAMLFAGKGLRKVDIKVFSPQELEQARTWTAATHARRIIILMRARPRSSGAVDD